MAGRIENYASLPAVLPPVPEGKIASERVQDLPQRFNNPWVQDHTLQITNRLLLNLRAVKEDLQLLKLPSLLTLEDYKEFVTLTDTELAVLNGLLGASPSILTQLADLTARVEALETP